MNISFSVEYEEPILDSEDTNQPLCITGLSSFLALALRLGVPILSAEVSRERWSTSNLGSGASFQVGRSLSSSKKPEISYVGPNITIGGDLSGLGDRVKTFNELVSKRIRLKLQNDVLDDRQRLAPMVREMRILGHKTLRDHDSIVRMLCLDWSGDSADLAGDRCWPSLLLECASHGTLDNYLTQAQQSSWDTKWMLFFNIVAGVLTLHEHDIAHCDLKPENILVFDKAVTGFDTVNVAAKICDFGFSVITSDFDDEAVFSGKAGTPPWNAPEIAFGLDPKIRDLYKADIYSLGLVFCTIVLDGRTPWQEISAAAFQVLREMDDDVLVSEVLQVVLSEISTESELQHEWAERILNSTVKTSPTDRTSASELLSIITMAFLSHIWEEEEQETTPDEQGDSSLPEGVGKVAVIGKAHALSLLKSQKNPVIPLLNVSSDDDYNLGDSNLLQGVPDFESPDVFRPCLLYKNALREVADDLERRADGQYGDPKEIISEVEYQLAICYLEGYGVEKNSTKGLEYLERAFRNGSAKARRATRNFYEAFGRHIPPEIESTEKGDLLSLAMDELGRIDEVPGSGHYFTAVKSLLFLYPSAYRELMCSSGPLKWKLLRFFMKFQPKRDSPSPDSMAEDFFKVTTSPLYTPGFDIPTATVFFQFAKEHSLLNKFDSSGLTMLHHAAAKGDVGLVKLLLELGTDVNISTPDLGWTPLWVACEVGCFGVANELIANGADLQCRENMSGRSILHLLSRFQSPKEIEYLIKKARESGLELEDLDSAGKTPLQVTFLDWDVSRGLAAKALLEMGSNPFLKNPEGWDSIVACVEILDPDLLRETLSCPAVQDVPDEVVYKSLARALGSIISRSPILHISWLGKRRETVIKDILTQLLSDESVKEHLLQEESLGMSPLTGAIFLDRDTLVLWLLDLRPQDVNLRGGNRRTSLQWAIERNRLDIVQNLLENGADPLISDGLGFNALHVAAIFVPSIMVNLADAIVQIHCDGDSTAAKSLLERGENDGYAPFAVAVLEGSDEHLRFAEKLRSKYSLDHDLCIGSSLQTLLGSIVTGGALFDICNTAQIEYLLHLTPKPRFVAAGGEGYTLLHLAVFGWKNADFSDGAAAYEILSLILREFPLLEHVQSLSRAGTTPIMMAAGCANHIAIRKIRDHATTHGFSLDINITGEGGLTALDIVGGHSMMLALEATDQDNPFRRANSSEYIPQDFEKLDRLTQRILSKNILRTYEILLQMGAARSTDLDGISIWTLIASPTSISNEQLISFLVNMKETHAGLNFDHLEGNEDSVVLEGSCVSLECSWRVTEFFLSIKIFEDITEAKEYAIERMRSGKKLLEFWTEEDDEAPWSTTEYSRRYFDGRVSWQRKGKAWSTDEILKLHHQVGLKWQQLTPTKSLMMITTRAL